MSVIIRLQNLPWSANAGDIRGFFKGLHIPEGGVHIVGGEQGDAFIAFASDEDARLAMRKTGEILKGIQISLLLSSRSEMQKVIETARQQALAQQSFLGSTAAAPAPAPVIPQQPPVAQHPAYTNPSAPADVAPAAPAGPPQPQQAYGNMPQFYPGMYGQQQQPLQQQQHFQQQQFGQQQQQSGSYYGRPSPQGPMPGSDAAMHQKGDVPPEFSHAGKPGYNQPSVMGASLDPSQAMMSQQQQPALKPPFGFGGGPMQGQFSNNHTEPGRGDPRWQRKEDPARLQSEPAKGVENQFEVHVNRPPTSYESNHHGPEHGRLSMKEVLDEKELYKLSQPVKTSFDAKAMIDAKAGFETSSRTPMQSRMQQFAYGQQGGSVNQADPIGQYRDQQRHPHAADSIPGKAVETDAKNHSSSYNSHGAPAKKNDYTSDKKHDRGGGSNRDREKDNKERDKSRDSERSSVKDPRDKDAFDRDRDTRRRRSKSPSRSRSRDRDRRRRHRSRSRSRDHGSRRRRSRSKERQDRSRDKDKSRSGTSSARDRPERRSSDADRSERRNSDANHDKSLPVADSSKALKNSGATLPGLGEIPHELPKELPTTILGKPASQEMITSDMYSSNKPYMTGASPMQQMWDTTSASELQKKLHGEPTILKNEQFPPPAYSTAPSSKSQSTRWGPPTAANDEKAEMMAFNAPGAKESPLNRTKEPWRPSPGAPGSWGRPRADDSGNAEQFPRKRGGVAEQPPSEMFPQDRYQRENRPFDPRLPPSAEHSKKEHYGDPRRPPVAEHSQKDNWGISEPPLRGILPPRDRNARAMSGTPEMRPRDPMYPEEGSRSGGPMHRDAPPRTPMGFKEGPPRGPIISPANSRVLLATPDIPPRGPMHGLEEWHPSTNKPFDEDRDPRARDMPPFRDGMNERPPHGPEHFKDARHPLDRPMDDRRPLKPMHDRPSLERGVDDRGFPERMGENPIGERPPIMDRRPGDNMGGSPFMEDRMRGERFGGDGPFPDEQFHEGPWDGANRGMGRRGGFEGGRGFGRGGRRGPGFYDDVPGDPYALDGRRTATPPVFDRPMRGGFRGGDIPGPPGYPVEQHFDGVRQSPPTTLRGRGAFPRGRGARGGGAPPPVMPERLATCSVEVLNLPPRVSYRAVRDAFFGIYMPKNCIKLLGDENGIRIGVALIRFQNERDVLEAVKCDGSYVFDNQIQVKLIDEEIYDKHEDANSIQFPGRAPNDHVTEGNMPSEWVHIMGMVHCNDEEAVAGIFKAYYINDILKEVIPGTKKATGSFFMRVSCPEEAFAVVHEMEGVEIGGSMLHLRQAMHEEVVHATLKPAERHMIEAADITAYELSGPAAEVHKERGPHPRDGNRGQNPYKLVRDNRGTNDTSKKGPLLATPAESTAESNNDDKVNTNDENLAKSSKQNSQSGPPKPADPLSQPESSAVKRPIEDVEPSHPEQSPQAKKAAPSVDLLTDSVVISDVKMGTTRADVVDFFSDDGLIPENIHFLPYDQQKGGRIYVVFPLISNSKQAIKKSGQFLGPSSIRIDLVAKPEVMSAMKLPFNPLELIRKGDGSLDPPAADTSIKDNHSEQKMTPEAADEPATSPALPGKGAEERSKPVRLIRQPLTNSVSQKPTRPGQQKPPAAQPSVPKQGEVIPDQFGQPGCVVALGNVPLHATTEDIIAFLSADFPHIVPENVIRRYNEHNQPTSDARVAFESSDQANEAIDKLSKRSIFNRSINLSLV